MKKKKDAFSQYTLDELADAIVFPIELTPEQQKEAREQLAAARKKTQESMTEQDRIGLLLLRLRFIIEDYIGSKKYDTEKTFGYFLKEYVDIFNVKRKDFADQISIDESLLSQLINMHRLPPDYVIIRLELHSENNIPAKYWLKIIEMQREHELTNDKAIRRKETKYVHNWAFVGR